MAVSGLALSYSGDLAFALAARTIGGVGGTVVGLVATKMVADWFDAREIVLAMSFLQMSWPFGAMIALPIQTWIAQSLGWQAVMASGAICSVAVLLAFAMIPRAAQLAQAAAAGRGTAAARGADAGGDIGRHLGRDESRLRFVLQLRAAVDGGAGIFADGCGVADQPVDLVHHSRHSGRRLSRAPRGPADHRDHCLQPDRRRVR